MSDDGQCPRCGHQLNSDQDTEGWIDADRKVWMGMAVVCPECNVHFGRDDFGNYVEASDVVRADYELDP